MFASLQSFVFLAVIATRGALASPVVSSIGFASSSAIGTSEVFVLDFPYIGILCVAVLCDL
ncbi:hypothetical protein EW026_g5085 [Hermanssonia centrifuga]|uniref:Secreted protein n=1 Tax=Hermanssonia centrifuga TaxID=98765 RepID=A0A4S4KFF4_9APHY|nr:hypothetical protein EW026_g5085 [Hermanssonia centrifuga]